VFITVFLFCRVCIGSTVRPFENDQEGNIPTAYSKQRSVSTCGAIQESFSNSNQGTVDMIASLHGLRSELERVLNSFGEAWGRAQVSEAGRADSWLALKKAECAQDGCAGTSGQLEPVGSLEEMLGDRFQQCWGGLTDKASELGRIVVMVMWPGQVCALHSSSLRLKSR
jgi:hypothetical protein